MSLPSNTGRVGYGLMNLTWKPKQTSDEQAFAAIKEACSAAPITILNSAEFYGQPDPFLNLKLLSRFYAANPEYNEKTILSVKGAIALGPNGELLGADASPEHLRKSVTNINALLASAGGKKKMDIFQPARIDKRIDIETTIKNLVTLKNEGHFDGIGLSEVSAATIRRAHAVHPIAVAEVEYSLWALDIEKNQILSTCKELDIPILAYSPLGRGFLTGAVKSPKDIPEGDFRHHLDRFQEEAFGTNLKLVDKIQSLAKEKGVTLPQLAIAWLLAQWDGIHPIPGSTRPEGVKESLGANNVSLTAKDLESIRAIAEGTTIVGTRYNAFAAPTLEG